MILSQSRAQLCKLRWAEAIDLRLFLPFFAFVDVEDLPEINQRMSPAAVIFLVVLVALRYAATALADQGLIPSGLSISLVTDILGLFTVAMMITMSVEMWLRARRLLSQARAEKALAV